MRLLAGLGVLAVVVGCGPAVAVGCGPDIDVRTALEVTDVTTGWFDAGIVDGKNKLVPSIAFRLKNVGSQPIGTIQLNVVFVLAPDSRELDDTFTRAIGRDGLARGASSERFVFRAKYGFTGEQPRAEILQHSQFQDARVRIQVKHASSQWVQVAEFPIERRLLTN